MYQAEQGFEEVVIDREILRWPYWERPQEPLYTYNRETEEA